jgi:hypothetical protein
VDLSEAQRVLLSTGDGTADPAALRALGDASVQALGRLRALAPMLPTGSGPELRHLLELLATGQAALTHQVVACGSACADVRDDLERIGALAGTSLAGGLTGAAGVDYGSANGSSRTTAPGAAVSVPGAPVTQPPGGPLPTSAPTGGPTASVPGASAPGVTASVPGVGITVPGPSLTTGSGGLPSVTLPPVEATLGPITASVSVPQTRPSPSASASSSTASSSCVIALGSICLGG